MIDNESVFFAKYKLKLPFAHNNRWKKKEKKKENSFLRLSFKTIKIDNIIIVFKMTLVVAYACTFFFIY